MPNAAPRPLRIFLALLSIITLVLVAFLLFILLAPEKIPGSPTPTATSAISGTQVPLFFVYTPTVTPPIIEFSNLSPGETPVSVKGRVNAPDSALRVYSRPGRDFPLLGDLNNKEVVDVIGKSQDGSYIWMATWSRH